MNRGRWAPALRALEVGAGVCWQLTSRERQLVYTSLTLLRKKGLGFRTRWHRGTLTVTRTA